MYRMKILIEQVEETERPVIMQVAQPDTEGGCSQTLSLASRSCCYTALLVQ